VGKGKKKEVLETPYAGLKIQVERRRGGRGRKKKGGRGCDLLLTPLTEGEDKGEKENRAVSSGVWTDEGRAIKAVEGGEKRKREKKKGRSQSFWLS